MNSTIKSILKFTLSLSIGLGILWWISRKLDIDRQLEDLAKTDFSWILLSLSIAIASHWSRAIRWNILLKPLGYSPKTSTTFYAVMVGYLANLALPRMGEVTRCGILSKQENIPLNKVLGSVIVERGFDLICLILLAIFTIIIQSQLLYSFVSDLFIKNLINPLTKLLANNYFIIIIALGILVSILVAAYILYIKIKTGDSKWAKYANKVKVLIDGFKSGLLSILKMDNKTGFFLHTVLIWLGYYLMVYVCFFSTPAVSVLEWIDGLTVLVLGSFGIVFPTPGGVGAYQLVVQSLLTELYSIKSEPAMVFANVVWFSQTIMVIIVGFLALARLTILGRNKNQNG
ncbi:MAG: flippase-like domain-containing protein [Flavobacteriales bacterium]|nr:flippase-like domain-containing protein [Flavobacteriales bacterium]